MASSSFMAQKFLNKLKRVEVEDFYEALISIGDFADLVNVRHISASLNLDQLKKMKSIRERDGEFLFNWMACKIQKHKIDQTRKKHHKVSLYLHGSRWPSSVQCRFDEFCASNSIDRITIASHHIALLSDLSKQEKKLPLLENKENKLQGSHLCDTYGCVSNEHISIEPKEINFDRRCCDGIVVHIYENTTNEFIILQISPCRHGIQHEDANDDFLKYSCRKIRAVYLNQKNLC